MAHAEMVTEVTLKMTGKEAIVLASILQKVSGLLAGPRREAFAIEEALTVAGVGYNPSVVIDAYCDDNEPTMQLADDLDILEDVRYN